MKSRATIVATALLLAIVGHAAAQAPPAKPPAQAPPPAATPAAKPQAPATSAAKPQAPVPVPAHAAAPATARASIVLLVTDASGGAIADVQVAMTGPVPREGVTARDGSLKLQALKPGSYRLRLESPNFITLERDVTVKAGSPVEVDVALDRAPPAPAPPPPAPAPTPAHSIASVPPDPNATVEFVALPDWIEKNLIGRSDPLKETVVGRTPVTTATVVQVRDPIKERGRTDADEMLYVIAGEGVLHAKGRDQALDAGSFVMVPRGVMYSLDRRGRNPLIMLSIVGK